MSLRSSERTRRMLMERKKRQREREYGCSSVGRPVVQPKSQSVIHSFIHSVIQSFIQSFIQPLRRQLSFTREAAPWLAADSLVAVGPKETGRATESRPFVIYFSPCSLFCLCEFAKPPSAAGWLYLFVYLFIILSFFLSFFQGQGLAAERLIP